MPVAANTSQHRLSDVPGPILKEPEKQLDLVGREDGGRAPCIVAE